MPCQQVIKAQKKKKKKKKTGEMHKEVNIKGTSIGEVFFFFFSIFQKDHKGCDPYTARLSRRGGSMVNTRTKTTQCKHKVPILLLYQFY